MNNQKMLNQRLLAAAQSHKGCTEVALSALSQGADIEAKDLLGDTALMRASMYGYIDIVRLLLEKGAAVEARNKDGITALMYASTNRHVKVVMTLLEADADIHAINKDNQTALSLAEMLERTEVVEILKRALERQQLLKTITVTSVETNLVGLHF